ncbi:MAG TPA: nucleotide pyrophosphohydrolase [Gammaproteobacteria bacterium]|nr:nucleotide pyrophosphohydrolase [Gammaproteobacteria bacterium]
MDPMEELKLKQREFADERDWEQFHSPKNLAMALSVEVAEIVEILQWLSEEESQSLTDEQRLEMQDEIGDVMNYLVRLADRLDIEPVQAAMQKIEKNRIKYPVETAKGTSAKYTEL